MPDDPFTPPARASVPLLSYWMLIVLMLFGIVSWVDRYIIAMLVVPIQADLHLTDFQIGLAMGPAVAVSGMVALALFGWASDRFSRRWVLLFGILIWTAGSVASALSASFVALGLARAMAASGDAALTPTSGPMIADTFPKSRLTAALAVVGTAPKLGMATAFAAAGLVLGSWASHGPVHLPIFGSLEPWRVTLLAVAVPGLLVAGLAFSFPEPARRVRDANAEGVDASTLIAFVRSHWRTLGYILVGFCFMGLCSGAIQNWTPTFITRQHGLTAAGYGPTMSIITLLGAAAIIPKGLAVDFFYRRGMRDAHIRFFTWLQMIGIPLLLITFLVRDVSTFFVMYGVLNVLTLSITLYLTAAIQMIVPSHLRGRMTAGMLLVVGLVIQGVAPPLVAFFTDFVFGDQARLGQSLVLVGATSLCLSLIFLRLSLRGLASFSNEPAVS